MGVFDLNDKSPIYVEKIMGSNIYYIDNFYKKPDTILKLLNTVPAKVHNPPTRKDSRFKSLNGIHFQDMRHNIRIEEMKYVNSYLSRICGENPHTDPDMLFTNKTRFFPTAFNDYKNNYWHPHTDPGYSALIYFNKNDTEYGTNLYKQIQPDTKHHCGEHVTPWRPKAYWKIVKTLKPKFNRCVLFDGKYFPHGMHIPNERYFGDEYRLNQIVPFSN